MWSRYVLFSRRPPVYVLIAIFAHTQTVVCHNDWYWRPSRCLPAHALLQLLLFAAMSADRNYLAINHLESMPGSGRC